MADGAEDFGAAYMERGMLTAGRVVEEEVEVEVVVVDGLAATTGLGSLFVTEEVVAAGGNEAGSSFLPPNKPKNPPDGAAVVEAAPGLGFTATATGGLTMGAGFTGAATGGF